MSTQSRFIQVVNTVLKRYRPKQPLKSFDLFSEKRVVWPSGSNVTAVD